MADTTGIDLRTESASRDERLAVAFPTLNATQLKALEAFGRRVHVPKDDHVWTVGDASVCMFVVLEGEMRIEDGRTGNYVATHHVGSFSGDIDVLSGRPTVVTAIAVTDMEILKVPGDCVRSIVGEIPAIGDIILRAFLMRRSLLQEMSSVGPLVIGSRYSPDTLRIREFLARNRFPFHWDDLEGDEATQKSLAEFDVTEDETPIVVVPSGEVLHVPSNAELAKALGINAALTEKVYDLVVIGAGPAGLAAAVYGASEGLSTLVLDSEGPGGQAGTSSRIENYMGFPQGISGRDLADRAVVQAERFGAQMLVPRTVCGISCSHHGSHIISLSEEESIEAKCVVLATGAAYRNLDADPEAKYVGRGVYYAATNIERMLCNDDPVAIVGAGNSAGQAAVFMAENSEHVYLVVRGDDLRKSMSSYLALRIERSDRITVLLDSEITKLMGEDCLESAELTNCKTGEKKVKPIRGIFVMIGAVPRTTWLPDSICRDPKGFVLTGLSLLKDKKWPLERPPFFLETSCPGVFAVGDVRCESVKRVASAVGEGSMSVALVHQYLAL